MTDRPPDEPAEDPKVQRRAFLRQLTGEAVVTTGRLAGLSTALRRSLVAAAIRDPDAPADDVPPAPADETPPPAPVEPPANTDPAAPAPEHPATPALAATARAPAPDPAALLSPQQHEQLERGTTAILGVNDASGAPHLTSSAFHWDRTVLRLPSMLFAARVARIDADPRVSVLVELGGDAWVAVTGEAEVVSGAAVEVEMLTILRKQMTDAEAADQWSELRASGERVVIRVRPTRFVWRLG